MPLPPGVAPTVVINGVGVFELVAEFREGFDIQAGPSARKGYLCSWPDRYTVAAGMIGLNSTTKVGGGITLNTPMQYPERSTMYARSIDIIPAGKPTQGTAQTSWEYAIIYANFGCLPWSFSGIDSNFQFQQIDPATPLIYCKQKISTSTGNWNMSTIGLATAAGNPVKGQVYALPLFLADVTLTFMKVPFYPAQQIFTAGLNPLNSTTFLGQAAGYWKFSGSDEDESRNTDGSFTRDIAYLFKFRNLQWDYTWDPVAGSFQQVCFAGGTTPVVGHSDLNTLIPSGYLL